MDTIREFLLVCCHELLRFNPITILSQKYIIEEPCALENKMEKSLHNWIQLVEHDWLIDWLNEWICKSLSDTTRRQFVEIHSQNQLTRKKISIPPTNSAPLISVTTPFLSRNSPSRLSSGNTRSEHSTWCNHPKLISSASHQIDTISMQQPPFSSWMPNSRF